MKSGCLVLIWASSIWIRLEIILLHATGKQQNSMSALDTQVSMNSVNSPQTNDLQVARRRCCGPSELCVTYVCVGSKVRRSMLFTTSTIFSRSSPKRRNSGDTHWTVDRSSSSYTSSTHRRPCCVYSHTQEQACCVSHYAGRWIAAVDGNLMVGLASIMTPASVATIRLGGRGVLYSQAPLVAVSVFEPAFERSLRRRRGWRWGRWRFQSRSECHRRTSCQMDRRPA